MATKISPFVISVPQLRTFEDHLPDAFASALSSLRPIVEYARYCDCPQEVIADIESTIKRVAGAMRATTARAAVAPEAFARIGDELRRLKLRVATVLLSNGLELDKVNPYGTSERAGIAGSRLGEANYHLSEALDAVCDALVSITNAAAELKRSERLLKG